MFSPLCIKGSHQANVFFCISISIVKTNVRLVNRVRFDLGDVNTFFQKSTPDVMLTVFLVDQYCPRFVYINRPKRLSWFPFIFIKSLVTTETMDEETATS